MSYKKYWAVIGILIGLLAGIKIYAAMLLLPAVGIVGIFLLIKRKELELLKASLIAGGLSLTLLLLGGKQSSFPFLWEPGWFFKTLFEAGDRLNFSRWELLRLEAVQHHGILRLLVLWTGAVLIFFVGNFGVKILGLLVAPKAINQALRQHNPFWLIIILVIIESFFVPSFFLQKGVVWNSIQFLHFAAIPLTLLLVLGIDQLKIKPRTRLGILIIFFLLALPTTITTVIEDQQPSVYTSYPPEMISDLAQLRFSYLDKELLLDPRLSSSSIVPAISGRVPYWADPIILSILEADHPERREFQLAVLNGQAQCQPNQVWVYPSGNRIRVEPCPLLPICYP